VRAHRLRLLTPLVAGLVAAILASPWPLGGVRAQSLPAAVVAVIDYQRLLRESAAARSIREQIESRRKAYQEEISKEQQRLQEADKELAKQRSLVSPEALTGKRREMEEGMAGLQKLVQERRRELDSASAAALNEVKRALLEVLAALADERGFNLVLPVSEVIWAPARMDVTEEVLSKLNERLPDVQVTKASP
jgi:outer membrane protein